LRGACLAVIALSSRSRLAFGLVLLDMGILPNSSRTSQACDLTRLVI